MVQEVNEDLEIDLSLPIYSTKQIADRLDYTREHVSRLIQSGALGAIKVGGRYIVPKEDLIIYLDMHGLGDKRGEHLRSDSDKRDNSWYKKPRKRKAENMENSEIQNIQNNQNSENSES